MKKFKRRILNRLKRKNFWKKILQNFILALVFSFITIIPDFVLKLGMDNYMAHFHANSFVFDKSNMKEVKLYLQYQEGKVVDEVVMPMLIVGATSKPTTVIPQKQNKIQFSSIEPLRGVGDVKDRFVFKDGKLMIERKCGHYIFNENTPWAGTDNTNLSLTSPIPRSGSIIGNCILFDL